MWRTIPVLEFLLQSWENMAEIQKFSTVKDAILKGLENIEKWYRKVNDTDAFFICLGNFFSPFDYIDSHFPLSFGSEYQDCLC